MQSAISHLTAPKEVSPINKRGSSHERKDKRVLTEYESQSSTASLSTMDNDADLLELSQENDISELMECQECIEMLLKALKGKKAVVAAASLDLRAIYFKTSIHRRIPCALRESKALELSRLSEKFFKSLYVMVLIAYDCSFNHSLFKLVINMLNRTLIQLNRICLILIDFFIHSITSATSSSKLLQVIALLQAKLSMTNKAHLIEITNVMSKLTVDISELLSKYKMTSIGNELQGFYENISTVSIEDIDLFFQGEVIRQCPFSSSFEDDHISYVSFSSIKAYSVNMSHPTNHALTPPRVNSSGKYFTLVLDLDETLIHFASCSNLEGKVLFRPHLFDFLKAVSQWYEVIVFTASIREYADIILNLIEAKIGHKVFQHRLYREHTSFINGKHVKDLMKIGRSLSRVLIVDNFEEAFSIQKENGIQIASFLGINKKDDCLLELSAILAKIYQEKPTNDIRTLLSSHREAIKARVSLV